EYKIAQAYFTDQKTKFFDKIKTLVEKYAELQESFVTNFTIYDKDIESVLSVSYFFKTIVNLENKTASFSASDDIIQNLESYTNGFEKNENWSFNDDDRKIISDFKSLLLEKKSEYETFKEIYGEKEYFVEAVNRLIAQQNSKLDSDGKEKGAANQRVDSLKTNFAT